MNLRHNWVTAYETVLSVVAPRLLGYLNDRAARRAMATDEEIELILHKAARCGYAPPICQIWDAYERMYSMIFLEKLAPGAAESEMGYRVVTWKAAKPRVLGAQRFSTNVSAVGAGVYSDTIIIDADYLYNPKNFVTAEAVAEAFVDQESRVD